MSDIVKKIQDEFRAGKCLNKGCESEQKDTPDIVWFGKQYEHKQITCSSCLIKNDEAMKKCIPSFQNVLPVSSFVKIFCDQLNKYEGLKKSSTWQPKIMKEKQKQMLIELDNFEVKLSDTLKSLVDALMNFSKKVSQACHLIFQNKTFDQIIESNNEGNNSNLIEKIILLLQNLNVSTQDSNYRFDNLDLREKRMQKLNEKIKYITEKTLKVLQNLLSTLKQKNEQIVKI